MIASLNGTVTAVSLDSAVVSVGGVGFLVQATPSTLAGLRIGTQATVATSLVVREDSLSLFGFLEGEERDVFELLLTVTGIGPRLAMAMLAVHTPDQLRRAVADEDLNALVRVPGIGRKGAQRIVLEIGDRLGPPLREGNRDPLVPAAGGAGRVPEVVEALVGLGWTARAAEQAVDTVTADGQDPADTAGVLRAALRALGGQRGSGGGRG